MSTPTADTEQEVQRVGSDSEARRMPAEDSGGGQSTDLGASLAVCALSGGAGASTLSYLFARASVSRLDRPVLLCDAGGPTGALSLYARAEAPRSLAGLANQLAAGEVPGEGLYADAGSGLRLLAGAPDLEEEADPDGLRRLIEDARGAHDLTVIDCGTLRGRLERQVLEWATHVAWAVPATVSGVRRARRVLNLFPLDSSRPEVVVARRDADERPVPTDELSAIAAARRAPLVLMPHIADLGEHEPASALEKAGVSLEAIWSVVRR